MQSITAAYVTSTLPALKLCTLPGGTIQDGRIDRQRVKRRGGGVVVKSPNTLVGSEISEEEIEDCDISNTGLRNAASTVSLAPVSGVTVAAT